MSNTQPRIHIYNWRGTTYESGIPVGGIEVPVIPISTDYVTNNPVIQSMCLEIITGLWKELLQILNQVKERELFRFFLHGTSVAPFVKHGFNSGIKFPYKLTSDFDCEVLLNPNLGQDGFDTHHKLLLDKIFIYLINVVKNPYYWPLVKSSAPLDENYPISVTENEYTPLNTIAKSLSGKYNNIPKDSPFYVFKQNEVYTRGRNGPTNISQVKFGIRIKNPNPGRPYKSLDLIDISIPKQSNEYIKQLWELTTGGLMLYQENIPSSKGSIKVEFPRLDLASAVLNLEYAASPERETRENKQKKRMNTAKNLRNFFKIISPKYPTPKSGGKQTRRRSKYSKK